MFWEMSFFAAPFNLRQALGGAVASLANDESRRPATCHRLLSRAGELLRHCLLVPLPRITSRFRFRKAKRQQLNSDNNLVTVVCILLGTVTTKWRNSIRGISPHDLLVLLKQWMF